jgi:mannose-6-phosphate isomerase
MVEPLFLKPVFHQKIWGGRHLATDFGYDIPAGTIGECWAISGHPHGPSRIINGEFKGQLLADVYAQHPELFGNPRTTVFPLLTKILDANASLSVQVHPDDAYAAAHEHELGKTECWYIIHAEAGAKLTYGHHAHSRAELAAMVEKQEWDRLFNYRPVKTGDFVYVPAGTIHALNKGIIALETQQSSDTTYRLYDYDRVNPQTGMKRELHIKPALAVTNVPFKEPRLAIQTVHKGDSKVTTLLSQPTSPFFSVYKWEVDGKLLRRHEHGPYTLLSVIDGAGTLQTAGREYQLVKGTHLLIPAPLTEWQLVGKMLIIASEPAPGYN